MHSHKRKSQYFEIDALIAMGILIIGIIYVRSLTIENPKADQNAQYSEQSV